VWGLIELQDSVVSDYVVPTVSKTVSEENPETNMEELVESIVPKKIHSANQG